MKLIVFLLFSFSMSIAARGLSQTVNYSCSNAPLSQVFSAIKKQTGYVFFYRNEDIATTKPVTVHLEHVPLQDALERLMKDQPVRFNILGQTIFITKRPAQVGSDIAPAALIPIQGRVLDANGQPIEGATIQVKGTNLRTITNSDGTFVLDNVDRSATLVITHVGYENIEIAVNKTGQLNIVLKLKENSMDEVIVIGYGMAKRKDVVGAVNVVSTEETGGNTAVTPSQLLQGQAAGVQVVQNSGLPGSDAQIIIRGTGSFTSINPLYVIDGIQGDINLFNSINIQDIDNITVLKDASATAIYGAAAANGVVIITTKKAKAGASRITINSKVGVSKAWKQLDLLKAKDYVDLVKDVADVQGVQLPDKFNAPAVLVDSTDWQNAIFKTGVMYDHHINISGGTDKFLYTISTGIISQESIVKDYTNNRLNFRINLEENLGRLKLGQTLNARYTRSKGAVATLLDAINMAPYKPIYDPTVIGGYAIVSNVEDLSNAGNPLQGINLANPVNSEFVFYPQVYGELNLLKGLRFRSQFSAKVGGSKSSDYTLERTAANYLFGARGANLGYGDYANYILENFFSYNKTFGVHELSATVGNSYIDPGKSAGLSAAGSNISNDNIRNISVALSQNVTGATSGYASTSLISYFGRLIYTYDNRYILSASMRRDGASNFGPNNRYGNFPSAGFAWRFTQEGFFDRISNTLTEGKLRIGWGRTGNNNIPAFLTDAVTYGGNPSGNLLYSLGLTETFVPGVTVNRIPNPNLKWEETDQIDLGLDLTFFNRMNFTVDLYKRKNSDLLVYVPLPTSNGIGGTGDVGSDIATNAATAENRGVEVSLGYNSNRNSVFRYSVSVNAAYNKNKVLSLGKEFLAPIRSGSFSNLPTFTYTATGFPIGSYFGYRVDHVARDQAEIDALNQAAIQKSGDPAAVYQNGLLPGDFIFKDLDNNGVLNEDDQEILGNPMPKVIYGLNASAEFKNFDLAVIVAGFSGLKLVNALRYYTAFADKPHNSTTDILNRWKQPGDVAPLPRAGQSAVNNLRPSDFYVQDGSFLRLRNVTIGYSIPAKALSNATHNVISRLRLYAAAENLFTATNYGGYDPEVSTQGNNGNYIFQRGIDEGQLPQPRTILVGLQLGF